MASTISRPSITDDDGSGTTGTIDDAAFWDSVFDAIDAMFSGAGAYATLTFGGSVAIASGILTVSKDSASLVRSQFLNPNTGTIQTDLQIGRGTNANDVYLGVNYSGVASAFIDNRSGGALQFRANGTTTVSLASGGGITVDVGHIQIASSSQVLNWASSTNLWAPADGHVEMTNFAITAGVRFRFTTDARFEVRNRANSDFADVYGKAAVFTGTVTAPTFIGDLTGTASGNLTGVSVGGDGDGTYTVIDSITVNSDGLVSAISGS